MIGPSGHGMLSRVRSHRKLRAAAAAEGMEVQKMGHRRQLSDSASVSRSASTTMRSDSRGHWPPIEWDPLKLNPPVPDGPAPPARLHERQPLQSLGNKRSFAGQENRRPPRLHHSDSGFSLEGYGDFDFAQEKAKALQIIDRNRQRDDDVHVKGYPSPASSVDSDKSWFDDDDDQEGEDGAVKRSNDIWEDAPSPRRRPQVGSPNDPTNFIKRGAWKRQGIFFGEQKEETRHDDEDDVFEI